APCPRRAGSRASDGLFHAASRGGCGQPAGQRAELGAAQRARPHHLPVQRRPRLGHTCLPTSQRRLIASGPRFAAVRLGSYEQTESTPLVDGPPRAASIWARRVALLSGAASI